jgi:ribonuclease D
MEWPNRLDGNEQGSRVRTGVAEIACRAGGAGSPHYGLCLGAESGFTRSVIDRSAALDALLPALRQASWIALDTEADSLHSYPEKLCLLQISLPGCDELVDPLAGLDLEPLFAELGRHELILHGADYDLRLLHRGHGFVPQAVFDTMLAARLLGHAQLGLDALAFGLLGVQMEKGSQKANWARRPLTERLRAYALNDTRHLKPIADRLRADLLRMGRLSWHRESCARLLEDSTRPRSVDLSEAWRIKGSSRLEPRAMAVLRQLWLWREEEALRLGRPPYFVLPHESLVALAASSIHSGAGEPSSSCRVPPRWRRAIDRTIQAGLAIPEPDWPVIERRIGPRLSRSQKRRYDELRQRRDEQAVRLGLDPSVIASRAAMVALAAGSDWHPSGLMRWQRELLGLEPGPPREAGLVAIGVEKESHSPK